MELYVDVEGKQAARYLERFAERYQVLETKYQESKIRYRPSERREAIAWKRYTISAFFLHSAY